MITYFICEDWQQPVSAASSELASSQDQSKSGSEAGPGFDAVSPAVAISRMYQHLVENKSLRKPVLTVQGIEKHH